MEDQDDVEQKLTGCTEVAAATKTKEMQVIIKQERVGEARAMG